MKLGVLARAYPYLQPLTEIELSYKQLLELEEFLKNCQDKADFYHEKHDKLLLTLGERIGESNNYKIKPEYYEKYRDEWKELNDVEVDLIPPEIPAYKLESAEFSLKALSALREVGIIKDTEEK